MKLEFYKYHGTGNDFVVIDDWDRKLRINKSVIQKICKRRFGIGADGLIILRPHKKYHFEMIYYNADGRTSSMCGNGGRCIVHFANMLGYAPRNMKFMAIDGLHLGMIKGKKIMLKMSDVPNISTNRGNIILDTGSPHFVQFVDEVDNINAVFKGRRIRNGKQFAQDGINVNFVQKMRGAQLKMATYERGVEDETYSCGTGVVAAAIASHYSDRIQKKEIAVKTKGGDLSVKFVCKDGQYSNIWLTGPAVLVSMGVVDTLHL